MASGFHAEAAVDGLGFDLLPMLALLFGHGEDSVKCPGQDPLVHRYLGGGRERARAKGSNGGEFGSDAFNADVGRLDDRRVLPVGNLPLVRSPTHDACPAAPSVDIAASRSSPTVRQSS